MRPRSSLPSSEPYTQTPKKIRAVKGGATPVGKMTAPSGRVYDIYSDRERSILLGLGWSILEDAK